MQTTAQLVFRTSRGGTRTVTIGQPLASVTQSVLDGAASSIIAAQPFDETVGNLEELQSATRVTVIRTPIVY